MTGWYGRLPHTPDPRDYRYTPPAPWEGPFVDLTAGFPEPPYDQGQLGSCVSNGTAAAVDYARVKQGLPPLKPPSRLFVYYQGRVRGGFPIDQDSGLQVRDGFTVLAKDGAPPESLWPYDIARFAERPPGAAYMAALADQAVKFGAVAQQDIDATLATGWPVVFGFDVYESFESSQTASTGVMPVPDTGSEQLLGGHCVVLASTPKPGADIPGADPALTYYLVRNSWGHDGSWGCPDRPGYFWMPSPVVHGQESSDFWMVTLMEDPAGPTPPVPPSPHSAVDRFIAMLRKEWAAFDVWLKAHGL